MIISISGKAQSGKDTTGKIINILLNSPHLNNEGIKTFLRKDVISNKNWHIKKFADKIKDIVCLLIGCTREQLEDESFKSKELGEEWWYFKGRNGSLISYSEYSKRNDEDLIKTTPRFLLQFIGTDLLRNQLHPEIWVNALMSEYITKSTLVSEVNYLGDSRCGICKKPTKDISYFLCDEHVEKSKNNFPNWIITDLRFPNELEAVKKRGGITIRVNRPCDICGGSGYHKMSCPVSKSGEHLSETSLDKAEFDYVIENSGSIEELIEKVKKILIKEKLL